jgi:hypothetical protein
MHQSVGDLCEQPSVDVITDMMSTVFDQMYSVMECQEPGTTHSDKLPLACKYKFPKELHILILIKLTNCYLLNLNFGVKRHFQQYFSYIMATSFIGGKSRSTGRKPPTMNK